MTITLIIIYEFELFIVLYWPYQHETKLQIHNMLEQEDEKHEDNNVKKRNSLQYRHLTSAPVDRTSANAWLYKRPC